MNHDKLVKKSRMDGYERQHALTIHVSTTSWVRMEENPQYDVYPCGSHFTTYSIHAPLIRNKELILKALTYIDPQSFYRNLMR